MTTKLSCEYIKSTEHADPRVQIVLHVPTLVLLKLFVLSLLNKHITLKHEMTEPDFELVAKTINRRNLVKNFRAIQKKHHGK